MATCTVVVVLPILGVDGNHTFDHWRIGIPPPFFSFSIKFYQHNLPLSTMTRNSTAGRLQGMADPAHAKSDGSILHP